MSVCDLPLSSPYEPSVGVQVLAALRAMFTKNRTEITSEQVVHELVADPDSPWHEYCGRGPITKNQVAALLPDYDIRPVVVHPTKRADCSRHGYRASSHRLAQARTVGCRQRPYHQRPEAAAAATPAHFATWFSRLITCRSGKPKSQAASARESRGAHSTPETAGPGGQLLHSDYMPIRGIRSTTWTPH